MNLMHIPSKGIWKIGYLGFDAYLPAGRLVCFLIFVVC